MEGLEDSLDYSLDDVNGSLNVMSLFETSKEQYKNLQTLKFEIKNIKSSLTEDEVGIKIDKLVGKREVEGPSRN